MATAVLTNPATNATWVNAFILVGSLIFMAGLAISAYFLPQWRVLHVAVRRIRVR